MSRNIKRSKSLRTWNKYKKLVYVLLAVLVIIAALIVIITRTISASKEKPTETAPIETETAFATQEETEEQTTEPETETETEPETTTSAVDIVRTPEKEDIEYESFYDDAILVGDVFVSGIGTYGVLSSSKLVSGETWTIGKASDAISTIKSSGASKVFIEIGLNDLNNGRSASTTYGLYEEFVADIQNALPDAQIYVVSLFPVTTGFEAKDSTTIKNTTVSELNDMLAGMEGVTFLNVNNSIANSDGSLNTDLSDSGYNIKPSYYGFILNLIAEMSQ